jgi:hypothetical protein
MRIDQSRIAGGAGAPVAKPAAGGLPEPDR